MKNRVQRSRNTYNEMADHYDTSPEGNYTKPHKAEILRQIVVHDGDSILDVACGNGTLLGDLSRKANVQAFGVDLSENMIAAAQKRYPNCTFMVSACAPLPFENECMDSMTVSCAFHHFEAPKVFASECMRILKPHGTIYLAEPAFSPVIRFLANTVVFPFSQSGDVKVYSAKELQSIFKSAGFVEIETYIKDTVLFFSAKK